MILKIVAAIFSRMETNVQVTVKLDKFKIKNIYENINLNMICK